MKLTTYFPTTLLTLALCHALIACEKPFNEEEQSKEAQTDKKMEIRFSSLTTNQSAFEGEDNAQQSRAASPTPITQLCTRINLAIFDAESGDKVASISQEKGDKTFGDITTNLNKGKYTIVIIAHNGEGNATISSPAKITFKDNKVTDTFYYCDEFDISESTSYDITLRRAVAMFRLVTKDPTPKSIHNIKFYYTGGSSTFDATTGYGCVNSKQTEMRTVTSAAYSEEASYDIYTFPHEDARKLKIEVSALENATATQATYAHVFENITMTRNHVRRLSGYFYKDDPETGRSFDMTTTDEWEYDDQEY